MEVLEDLPGFTGVRALNGFRDEVFAARFEEGIKALVARPMGAGGARDFDVLVLSSGGANGAFGAGALAGWTASGLRPDFELVTGVSTGALLAPFAFAGPAYDGRLEELFRGSKASDVMKSKGILRALAWDESLMDSTPLRERIEASVDMELMGAVAARHRAGARCLVGTTQLDRGQFVIWDLGAIACLGTPEALALMRSVMLASASVPVMFPPVRFQMRTGDELHVDGAICHSLFLPETVLDPDSAVAKVGLTWEDFDTTVYVINNGCLRASPTTIQRDTLEIASRSILVMAYNSLADEIFHVFVVSRLFGTKFRFMAIPDGQEVLLNDFGPGDTEELYQLGRRQFEGEPRWSHAPPGYVVPEELFGTPTERLVIPPAE